MKASTVNVVLLSLASFSSTTALVTPNNLQSGWSYSGCYTEVKDRALKAASFVNNSMTAESCIAFCDSKGYAFAGTEWYHECYCGASLASGTAKTAETDCNTPCDGNATEACGGPSRLSIFNNPNNVGPQPNYGVQDWPYIGCFMEGTTGRALTYGANLPSNQVNAQNCTAACKAAGFILAGTEYSGECYCGNSLENGGVLAANPSDCNMVCNGNGIELCGGPDRLNVYDYKMMFPAVQVTPTFTITASSVSSTSISPASSPTSSTLTTSTSPAASPTSTASTTNPGTPTASSSQSSSTSFSTFPVSAPSSSSISNGVTSGASTSVTSASTFTSVLSTVSSTTTTSTTTAAAAATATPTAPSQPNVVQNYIFYGCKTEATKGRALFEYTYADDAMTLESCQAFCAGKGSTYFGTEYGRECYCGNSFAAGSVDAPAGDCTQLCAGNKLEFCGNGNRLSVYVKNGTALPSSSTTAASPSNTIATSTSVSSTVPAQTGLPAGWTSQGCWQDGPNGRIMPTYQAPDNQALTQQSCANLCSSQGYSISGTEYLSQCFCSNAIYNGGAKAVDQTSCNTACSGDKTEMCGGPGYLTIISQGAPQIYQPPTVQLSGLNNTWTYAGCYEDNVNNQRTLPWALHFPGTMTPTQCLAKCGSFRYAAAGLEYGDECYCGDPANIAALGLAKRPDSECNIVCAGNASAICGGGSRLSTYFWSGTPLYNWGFPQAQQQAGTYSNLVGGVVTPLMTMQSITGKVTFLEKWGTGAANSTGAYELDLSQTNNFAATWRTMHLKTDVFCSAGIILPDKAGRQLTIGGWSLDSTYGVRLYTPDGSAGIPGVNDWQENVNTLKLQVGRWYPSAMIMTNGSILVVGGETGSNAAAVPSLEILPYTGTAPLYMDWLARTDPNNLYPFLCVLPGGGIFVGYWNEARILNEKTFETMATLPNIPGAVNDDTGGRTYPLEGTAILLPQYAPYTNPLGVLICGGSTLGHEALDNCASIYPEAANPTWTLERMPSKRVMSCMAPLPDGTYLIANGAEEGVAGFGLATNPNLNAVLYDPSQPVHSRMTVMANTTVARLYHSEVITLLDGRVLITGSDPQDGVHPEEIRVEVFTPPYLYSGKPRPSFNITNKDWAYNQAITFSLGSAAQNGGKGIQVSLLGAVSSTHGNSMGARTLFPAVSCTGTSCTVTAPPSVYIAPPGWYQMFVLDGGIPAVGVYVRIGGDPAGLGNWPQGADFTRPGLGPYTG